MKHNPLSIFAEEDAPSSPSPRQNFSYQSDRETLNKLKDEDLIAFNSVAESEFADALCALLDEHRKVTAREAVNETAFELDLSPVTTKRYLSKHTARNAQFAIVNKFVVCKIHNHERKYDVKVIKRNPHI